MVANLYPADIREATAYAKDGITTAPLTLYVDPTGNDTTGKGTLALPYLTVNRAMQDVPRKIAHAVQVRILGSLTTKERWFEQGCPEIVGDGSFAIFGVGAPTRKAGDGGPHTVTGVTSIGLTGQKLTIGAGGLTPHAFKNYFLRVVTGANPAWTYRVVDNDASNIWLSCDSMYGTGVSALDTVEIIRPNVKVALECICLNYRQESNAGISAGAQYSQFVVANLWIDSSASTNTYVMQVGGTALAPYILDFVLFEDVGGATRGTAFLPGMQLNYWAPVDTTYGAASLMGIANELSTLVTTTASPGLMIFSSAGISGTQVFAYANTYLFSISIDGTLQFAAPCGNTYIFGSAAIVECFAYANGSYLALLLQGKNNTTPAVAVMGDMELVINVLGACNYAVDVGDNSRVVVYEDSTCDSTLTDKSAVCVGAFSQVLLGGAMTNFKGNTAGQKAYIFKMAVGTKSDNWPAASTLITDAKAANLMRTA